jgi:hypothetical protein
MVLWTTAATTVYRSTVDRWPSRRRSHWSEHVWPLRGTEACHDRGKSERRWQGNLLRSSRVSMMVRWGWWWWTKVAATPLPRQLARSARKWSGAGKRNVVENGEVEVPFIGLGRRWRGGEMADWWSGKFRLRLSSLKRGGESTGCCFSEGKWRGGDGALFPFQLDARGW